MKKNIITLLISLFLTACAAHPTKPVSARNSFKNGYSLIFNNFSSAERMKIEEYLVGFAGYQHHRPVDCSRRSCEYWYESEISSARLNRNIYHMLKRMGIEVNVVFGGNTFRVDRITLRRPDRFISPGIAAN